MCLTVLNHKTPDYCAKQKVCAIINAQTFHIYPQMYMLPPLAYSSSSLFRAGFFSSG